MCNLITRAVLTITDNTDLYRYGKPFIYIHSEFMRFGDLFRLYWETNLLHTAADNNYDLRLKY